MVVLNVWAVWCEPCKREMPTLVKLSREYETRGVSFVGASIDDAEEVEKAKSFARKKHVAYPLFFGATTADMIGFRLGDAVPVTVVFDREGAPRFRLVGEISEDDLRQRVDWLLDPGTHEAPAELTVPKGMSIAHFVQDHERGESAEEHHEDQQAMEEGGSAVPG